MSDIFEDRQRFWKEYLEKTECIFYDLQRAFYLKNFVKVITE